MKHYFFSLMFFFFFLFNGTTTKAQWVTIPDTAFVNYLQATFPSCMSGNMMDTTCQGVTGTVALLCSHGNITNLDGIQYFDQLISLHCYNNLITSIPALPNNIMFLFADGNRLSTLPPLPNSLNIIAIRQNLFTTLAALPSNLGTLDCRDNQLTTLPTLPNTLRGLDCGGNQITTLPSFPDSINYVTCDSNQLTVLPTLPDSLLGLSCSSNQLNVLPALPNSLQDLHCGNNPISVLPALPNTLMHLDCSNTLLINLPALPDTLENLNCNQTLITALPALPNKLIQLLCNNNSLTSLPTLPDSLNWLQCRNNNLTILPTLPNNLGILLCDTNQLTFLPPLPNRLLYIVCNNNQLTALPKLPDYLRYLYCNNNPGLTCLPELKSVEDFDFSNTGITCLPNYPQANVTSNPPLSTVPLCNLFNNTGCPVFWNISGRTYYDLNQNCLADASETGYENFKVKLYQNNVLVQQVYTGHEGFYSFDTDTGTFTYSIDTANIPVHVICPDTAYHTSMLTNIDSVDYSMDFGLECKGGFDLAVQSIINCNGSSRPAQYNYIHIDAGDMSNFYGAHCTAGVSGTLQVELSGAMHYVSNAGYLAPTSVNGNTIVWNIADFGTINFFHDFGFNIQIDTNATLGSLVCIVVTITPTSGDYNVSNNILSQCWGVVNSYDPNEKEVYPSGNTDTAQKELTYTIHFQNTGTAEAQHIHVDDTLDTDLDASTFQLLVYSHQPLVQIKGNNVRFNFPNINLPDSNTNEPASHGYVQYKVKLKNNLPLGTQINNTAYIYFDFNAPVVTNTTTNTIATNTGIQQLPTATANFLLYPNPTANAVNISISENLIGSTLTVTDITGRRIAAVQLTTQQSTVNTQNFSNGIYFLSVAKEGIVLSQKLVVNR